MRKLLTAVTLIVASSALLTGCGGGGGGATTTSSSSSVTGATYASFIEGAKVCIEDSNKNVITVNGTELCSTTADDGTFTIQIPQGVTLSNDNWVGLYIVDQNGDFIKIADVSITQVEVDNSTNVLEITPENLAAGNETLANQIGALIHAIGGDLDGNATVVDLSNATIEDVEVQTQDNQTEPLQNLSNVSLADLLKNKKAIIIKSYHKLLNKEYLIQVNATDSQEPVTCKLGTVIKKLNYNWKEHQQEIKEHLQALQYLASGNVKQFELHRLTSLIDSISKKLQTIATNGLLPSDEVSDVQSVVSELMNVVEDLKTSGLTEDTKDEIQNALTDVNSLIEALSSTNNFSIITFSLQRLASTIESLIQNSTEVESTQQTSNETQVQTNQEEESNNQTQVQTNQESQGPNQTQSQTNQELQSGNQTGAHLNQGLGSSNQTQVQVNQESHEELQSSNQTQS
ncbi:MAG: hypothetical protein DSZ26_00100 [Thermovibrio sp.]|nr:MAG: hypothetical protein DSZ26_00100 [Thermovibrio sp.]